jgi:RNA polymerase sigma factor (sigma-70 family)
LSRADRDDILATAILWCWENRTTYNPSVSLDDWFVGAIRNARRAWENGETHEATELTEAIAVPDDTSIKAELLQVEERINACINALAPKEQAIAVKQVNGWTRDEIAAELHVSAREVSQVRNKLAPLQKYIPDSRDWKRIVRKATVTDSDDMSDELASIDRDIERVEFAPPAGKDCPPCWRCKWFEGYMPVGKYKVPLMRVVEPAIRAAVLEVEARKLNIAMAVRGGTIFTR